MKVKELITFLEKYDPEEDVYTEDVAWEEPYIRILEDDDLYITTAEVTQWRKENE